MTTEKDYLVALALAPGIGNTRLKILLKHFKKAEKVWQTESKILREILGESVYQKFESFRQKTDPEQKVSEIEAKNIKITTLFEKTYPKRLKQIFDPPAVLYIKGSVDADEQALAVVGSRKLTSYGKEVTKLLISQLADASLTIVSGLARGVDSLAHQTALDVGLRTIAVFGCGVDIIYPPENKRLALEIEKNGALISEIPPGIAPSKGYFPARNRIISGLSLGVLVTEAGAESGSLITATQALEQNREVFAVPGPIYSQLSHGPSELIKQGAKLVTSAKDILDELNFDTEFREQKVKSIKGENEQENLIIGLLSNEVKHIDQLSREAKLSTNEVGSLLLNLELRGLVKSLGSGNYGLSR